MQDLLQKYVRDGMINDIASIMNRNSDYPYVTCAVVMI